MVWRVAAAATYPSEPRPGCWSAPTKEDPRGADGCAAAVAERDRGHGLALHDMTREQGYIDRLSWQASLTG